MAVYGFDGRIGQNRPPVDDTVAKILAGVKVPTLPKFVSTGKGMKPSDILANQKFEYDVLKDTQAAQEAEAKKNALIGYYKSGGYKTNTDSLMSSYDAMQASSEAAINKQLADSLAGIGESYGKAQGITEQGYGDLLNYLSANQQDPYSQVRVQNVAPTQLEAQGLLEARGALSPDVLAYQQAVTSAGQSGAEQYQNLLNVLSSLNKSGNVSRASEAQMGRNIALTGLGEQRAGYESGLKSSAQSSLAQLAATIAQKKLEAQAQADAQAASLLETLAGLGIDVTDLVNPPAPPPPAIDLSQIDFSGLNNMFGPGFGSGR